MDTANSGTTAVQVSPTQEDADVSKVREVFDRAINAIVQASELAKVVQDMKVQLAELQQTINAVRDRNNWLDDQLTTTRKSRDDAMLELSTTRGELGQVKAELARVTHDRDVTVTQRDNLSNTLAQEKERADNAEMHAMDLEDKLKASEAKLASVQAKLTDIHSMFAPPAIPTPQPTPTSDQPTSQQGQEASTSGGSGQASPPSSPEGSTPSASTFGHGQPWWVKEAEANKAEAGKQAMGW